MKKNLVILIFGLAILSCKKEDVCNVDQFVGTWKGNSVCTIGGTSSETIVITKQSDSKISLTGGEFSATTLTRDDCELEGGVTVLGVGNKITGSITSDGKTLTIVSDFTVEKCTYTLTK